jgi:hypothetical protein
MVQKLTKKEKKLAKLAEDKAFSQLNTPVT